VAGVLNQNDKQSMSTEVSLERLQLDAECKHRELGVDSKSLDPSQMEKLY